jgi:hypothetical protein
MVAAYEALAAEGEYRGDLQRLCSGATFPRLVELDDEARFGKILDFADRLAKSPRTKELAGVLGQAAAADRGKILRDAGAKVDVFSCEVGKILESPQAQPKPSGPPVVKVWATPQVIGSIKEEELAKAVVDVTPAMTDCYRKGLQRKPDLAGKVSVKLQIDPDGNVTRDAPADLAMEDHETLTCILGAMKAMKFPKNPGPVVSALVPLELTTR